MKNACWLLDAKLNYIHFLFLFACYSYVFFLFLQHKERDFVLKFSAMEIYNEVVRDLLSSDSTPLRLLDDAEVRRCASVCFINEFIAWKANFSS